MSDNIPPKIERKVVQVEENESNIDKALNTKGFAEFLAQHPDAEEFDMNDEDAINKRFEVFESKSIVAKGIKELYSGHIEKEMGIKLDSNDLATIERHIEEQAINNPDEIINLREQLNSFKEEPKKIAELEKQLAQLGNVDNLSKRLESLRTDADNIESGKKYLGFVGKSRLAYHLVKVAFKTIPVDVEMSTGFKLSSKEYNDRAIYERINLEKSWDSADAVTKKYDKMNGEKAESLLEQINAEIETTQATLDKIAEIESLKSESQNLFASMRSELLGGVAGMAELTKSIQTKVADQLRELAEKGTIKAYDQAQARYESLRSVAESTETGVNPIRPYFGEYLQDYLDASLEKEVSSQIEKTLLNAKMGDNALTKLEKELEPFLKREKIGSKSGDEVRELISEVFTKVSDSLGDSVEHKAKKLLISRILIRMKS